MDLTTLTSTPTASAQIGDTKLYIYGPSTSDIAKLKELAEADAQTAFKVLVGLICSEIDITGKPRAELPKLSDSKIDTLVERADELARALLDSAFLRWISMDAERPPRTATEDDVQYLMRSVQHYIESQRDHTRALFASLSGSDSSRFKELNRVTESLRSLADLNAPFVQQRRERARELTAQEQTAAMTAKSSEALVKLIETTAIFIDEFDRRSQVADKTTAHQIVLAKRGIYVSEVAPVV